MGAQSFPGAIPPQKILPTTLSPLFPVRDRLLGARRELWGLAQVLGGSAQVLRGLVHPSNAGGCLGSRGFEGGMQEGVGWIWRDKCQSCLDAQKCVRKVKYLGARGKSGCIPRPAGPPSWAGGCLQPMVGLVRESPKQGTSYAALHCTRAYELVTTHERCLILAPSRQWGPVSEEGGMLGEVALQCGAAPGAEHPLGTPGAVVTAMALQSHWY